MRRIVRHIRQVGAQLLYSSGLLELIAQHRLAGRCAVLTYHRVLDESRARLANSNPGIVVSDKIFEMHMRTLRDRFNPVSLSQFQSWLDDQVSLPPQSCLVTFDDGWLDNFEVAYPILKKYDIPACIFLPVRYISSADMFWQEEILMRLAAMASDTGGETAAQLKSLIGIPDDERVVSTDDLQQFVTNLKSLSYVELDKVIHNIRTATASYANVSHYNRYLSWEHVAEMKASGIEFASHGVSHRILSKLAASQCREELIQSRAELRDHLGEPVSAIAYPNGGFSKDVIDEARKAGFSTGFTTRPGHATPQTDPLLVPRINIHSGNSDSEARFIGTCARVI